MAKLFIISIILSICILITGCGDRINRNTVNRIVSGEKNQKKRVNALEHLLKTFSSDKDAKPLEVPIWEHWLRKTGELPPDFDELQTNAFPPELLHFQNGKPVASSNQWPVRKLEIKKALEQYMFGNWPPPPTKIAIKYQKPESTENDLYTKQSVQLFFAPSNKAVEFVEQYNTYNEYIATSKYWNDYSDFMVAMLNIELYIPTGGVEPFPAIIECASEQQTLRPQDIEKLKRGYIVVRYYRKDADNIPRVYVEYECNQLEWWAYAAGRCVDLLYTMPNVDKSKIAITGHSRGGKTALLAAVMDERINAIIDSHPGTGAGSFNLWRYAGDKYGGETLESSTRQFPYWNNPRMRFFIGRENKLPFDSHFLLALIAPRPCLLGTGEHDKVGEVWGDQQCYLAAKKVYQFLGNEQKLGFYASPGGHEVTPKMINDNLDWLDMQFGRKPFNFTEKLVYSYSFDEWKKTTGEKLNIFDFPKRDLNDILQMSNGEKIKVKSEWETKAENIRNHIKLIIGDIPTYDKIQKINLVNERAFGDNLIKAEIPIDENLIAHITYPADKLNKIPVVIYLHAYLDANGYNWSKGFGYSTSVTERIAQKGMLAVEFDQFGYGLRNRDCGIEFYEKNRNSSALGVMIKDVRKIIDAVSLLDWVDKDKIMVAGYSLGGMVGLYSAVFDERIHAVASTCGFGSMRMDVHGNQTEGLKRYSHLRPTIPRLGLFLDNEKRIPFDFHEVLALIAPRPVFILAPKLDQDWLHEDVKVCYREASKIFDLYGKRENIVLSSPNDFNRYSPEYQEIIDDWFVNLAE